MEHIERHKKALDSFPYDQFERLMEVFFEAYRNERRIFVMGNGGSAATASHWVCDINKCCSLEKGKRFKMVCLNESVSTMLAYANDMSYEDVFVEQLQNFFVEGDVVIGISGSGNSANVLNAIEYAKANGGTTIELCGYDGGKLYPIVDIPLLINVSDMQLVEEIHMVVVHMVMKRLIQARKD